MKKTIILIALGTLLLSMAKAQTSVYQGNKPPLAPLKYIPLPVGTIQPKGWLHQQLQTMLHSTTGHLDETYPKIARDNGWLGGKGESWEETPYWLDGAVPLAYLLKDEILQAKIKKYVDWNLTHQRSNGYFGPLTETEHQKKPFTAFQQGSDWWPKMVMLKVMQQYYSATNDARVIPFMRNYFKYQYEALQTCPLGQWSEWATARGGDNIMLVYWLYNQTGDAFLLELGKHLYQQTTPWTAYLAERNWVMKAAANQTGEKWMDRHAVNVAMGLKLPAVYYQSEKTPYYLDAIRQGWKDLMTLHGLPHGMFSGDEDLHGNEPSQGVELCAIVETMFSLENIISITGETLYMDALERMTYNALPTQTTDDYVSRQYFQIANQVQVARGTFDFSLPFQREMTNVFGPYAGYTCCTANMHQGWTKFTNHLWYATPQGGLASLLYAPCVVQAKVAQGAIVQIEEQTNYPFEDAIQFSLKTKQQVAFSWSFRIPNWCEEAEIWLNGSLLQKAKGDQVITIARTWQDNDRIVLQLPSRIKTSNWARNSRAVEKGALVYALKIDETWVKDSIPEEGTYFQILPKSDWNYALSQKLIENPATGITVHTNKMPETNVWSRDNAPIELSLKARKLPTWQLSQGVARLPVTTREGYYQGKVEPKEHTITLIPYGCSKLRIVAFPIVK